jgi:hypothetical protein
MQYEGTFAEAMVAALDQVDRIDVPVKIGLRKQPLCEWVQCNCAKAGSCNSDYLAKVSR